MDGIAGVPRKLEALKPSQNMSKWLTEGNNYLSHSAHFEGHRCHSKVAMGPPSSLRAKEIQPGMAHEELYIYIYIYI